MEEARFWLFVIQSVVIAICLAVTAYKSKIFITEITDWYPVTIWSLTTCLMVLGIVHGSCDYFLDDYKQTVATILNTMVFINACVLFWAFSWGLFLISA